MKVVVCNRHDIGGYYALVYEKNVWRCKRMNIKAMTRNEVANVGLNGSATITDLYTNKKLAVRISVSRTYHHSDWQPERKQDVETAKSILGKWSWGQNGGKSAGVRPTLMEWGNNKTACSIHLMPHDNHLYGSYAYKISEDAVLRHGGLANWGHFCCHYIDSLALRANGIDAWNTAMHEAVRVAVELLGNSPPQPTVVPPQSTARPVIRLGASGKPTEELQVLLNKHGANPKLTEDGDFGTKTDAAVRAFQKANGLDVDGIVGNKTWAALDGKPVEIYVPETVTTYTVKPGDSLSLIASRLGINISYIAQVNNIVDLNKIYVGQVLKIPK